MVIFRERPRRRNNLRDRSEASPRLFGLPKSTTGEYSDHAKTQRVQGRKDVTYQALCVFAHFASLRDLLSPLSGAHWVILSVRVSCVCRDNVTYPAQSSSCADPETGCDD